MPKHRPRADEPLGERSSYDRSRVETGRRACGRVKCMMYSGWPEFSFRKSQTIMVKRNRAGSPFFDASKHRRRQGSKPE